MELPGARVLKLSKRFGPVHALDNVSLELSPGMLHGIVGPNGAGKTTFLRLLMGLLKPTAGTIDYYRGEAPVDFSELRPKMAYFPQEQSLYPDLSCREHMEFFRDLYRISAPDYEARSRELLHLTRLEPFLDRKAGQLSGGMYKKLGLMCVLLHRPEILLLDEPTIGVDPISRRELWGMLHRFVGEKVLIVMSTSYMDEAERCSRVHLFEAGRLILSGNPRTLLKEAGAHDFEQIFLARTAKGHAP